MSSYAAERDSAVHSMTESTSRSLTRALSLIVHFLEVGDLVTRLVVEVRLDDE